jgi:hypothetical protein
MRPMTNSRTIAQSMARCANSSLRRNQLKRLGLGFFLCCLTITCMPLPFALAQQGPFPGPDLHVGYGVGVIPLQGIDPADVKAQADSGMTIPLWFGSIRYGGTTYQFNMVGKSPLTTTTTSTVVVKAPIISVIFEFADGTVFDPTAPDPVCSPAGSAYNLTMASPIFKSHKYVWGGTSVGNTQYIDAFQRANFWKYTSPGSNNPNYHVLLATTQNWRVRIIVPSDAGHTKAAPCGRLGIINSIAWLGSVPSLFADLNAVGVNATMFPIFLFYNVVLADYSKNFIESGYHAAFVDRFGHFQTYAVAAYDSSSSFGAGFKDVSILSHEVGEWMDDPMGTNPAPAWGHIGQEVGCQSKPEVGDPLTGTVIPVTMSNRITYHPQQLAFFSWFYHQKPSIAINGWYSNLGKFQGPPPICH